ncbi:hypothetical protein GCM10025789_23560 [Tessaracoccus lubricantis]|uniref:ApeA N-terminal domain-containing protein n=1 Tax=Tessaracoccus lubricantis TaxID=545543 RepID=A0ABP9FII2_9ACTN
MSDFVVVLVVVLVLAAVGLGVWGMLRHRYVQSLRAKGWEFITSPPLSIVHGLNVPPFGVGFDRRVDDQLLGRAKDGTPFSAFKYACGGWRSDGYVVTMPLPKSLPPGEVVHGGDTRIPALGEAVEAGALRASAPTRGYAQELLAVAGAHLHGPYRVSVDHDNLVLVDAPREADLLEGAIEQLAAVRAALLASTITQYSGPRPPEGLSFHGRPDWAYVPRDDSYLGSVSSTGGGFDHEAHDIIVSRNHGLPFVRLRHTWKTRHTRRDSNGNTTTEIRHHEEVLCEFRTTFPFEDLSVNWGLFGRSQKFEWEDFNRRFTVRADNPKFCSDVIHQRQMEFLMHADAPKFQIAAGVIRVGDGGDWLPADVDRTSQFLHGFFGRVPNFVWQELGAWPRPIAELEPR